MRERRGYDANINLVLLALSLWLSFDHRADNRMSAWIGTSRPQTLLEALLLPPHPPGHRIFRTILVSEVAWNNWNALYKEVQTIHLCYHVTSLWLHNRHRLNKDNDAYQASFVTRISWILKKKNICNEESALKFSCFEWSTNILNW